MKEKNDSENEDILRIEFNLNKQKEVSQKLFTNLMNEKEVLKDDLDLANYVIKEGEAFSKAAEEQKESLLILKDEVEKLQFENFEKMELLRKIEVVNKALSEKVNSLEV